MKATLEHTVAYDDLAQTWKAIVAGSYKFPAGGFVAQNGAVANFYRSVWAEDTRFCGMTVEDMSHAIDHGYVVEGMEVPKGTQTRTRRRPRLSEDQGELQVDIALSGHDRPFMHRPKVKRQAGLTVNFELAVGADTPASVLSDYATFMAALIAGMQAKGFDLAINVVSRAKGVAQSGESTETTIKVKRFGKRSDLKSWGAILSPGGFRMLVFTSRMLTCHANRKVCSSEMGGSYGPEWGLEFDAKERVLTVKCKAHTSRFPREQMEAELAALPL